MTEFFSKARPVWPEKLEKEMNITVGLHTAVSGNEKAVLKVATSGFYRVFVNGAFTSYGPARCAHGHYRVDELRLTLHDGINHIAVEVVNYYINSFASLMQPGFIQMELIENGETVAATGIGGFSSFVLTDRVRKMQRFSYQRPMGESYRLARDAYDWRMGALGSNTIPCEMAVTEQKTLVPRRIDNLRFYECRPDKQLSIGTLITGVKPETYKRDRALTMIGDPEKSELGGFREDEMELHLSDEVQEWRTTSIKPAEMRYNGTITLSAGQFTVLSLPCEKTGFITAEIACHEAGTLYFAVDETLRQNGDVDPLSMECLNVIRIEMQPGKYDFISMESFGLKYIKTVCTAGRIAVRNLRITELVCPQPITAAYAGMDTKLVAVYRAAVETFKQNAVDVFMDCPTRERAGWLCDSFFTARTEYALTGDNAIERNYLENFLLPEKFEFLPEGMLPMCYPADTLAGQFIPNWAMWFVIELEDYVCRTKDADFVKTFRRRVYDLLAYFRKFENQDGLLERLENWVFVEWSHANALVQDINFPTNMLYARMLQAVSNLFNDTAMAEKSEKLKAIIRHRSFDGEFFTDNEVYKDKDVPESTKERTETCQYYAFFTDVATPDTYPALWKRLLTEFGPHRTETGLWPDVWPSNAFIGNFLRLELLRREGHYEQLLQECTDYFYYMAERTGTLWENTTDYASCNHGFASYAAVFLLEAQAKRASKEERMAK